MKKILTLFITVFALISFSYVNATCYDNDINDWAEKLEITMKEITDESYPYSYLLMLNSPKENLRVVASDTYSNGEYEVEYDTTFKNYVIGSEIHFVDKKYTIKIYSNDTEGNCYNELLKTITYTVPAYNSYNDTLYCEENPDADICGGYKKVEKNDENDKTIKDYYNDILENEEFENMTWYQKVINIFLKYVLYVIIPIVFFSGIYLVIIKKVKKRSEDK